MAGLPGDDRVNAEGTSTRHLNPALRQTLSHTPSISISHTLSHTLSHTPNPVFLTKHFQPRTSTGISEGRRHICTRS